MQLDSSASTVKTDLEHLVELRCEEIKERVPVPVPVPVAVPVPVLVSVSVSVPVPALHYTSQLH